MKKMMLFILMCLMADLSWSQEFSDTQELNLDGATFIRIANINGQVVVTGTNENSVRVTAERTLNPRNNSNLESLKSDVKIDSKKSGDTLLIYIAGLPTCQCEGDEKALSEWRYNFQDWDDDFDYKFDLELSVPSSASVRVSTVNEGDIEISGVSGAIFANNINGAISISNIQEKVRARTINGDLDLDFVSEPVSESRFYTLNGDIRANFNEPINADITFESFNGDFYTNVEQVKQSVITETSEDDTNRGVKYKVGSKRVITIRNGGIKMDFETFNGDVILKENSI